MLNCKYNFQKGNGFVSEMQNIYTVAFFGHRHMDHQLFLEELLEEHIYRLMDENEYVDFLVGRNGDFDICASSAVYRVQRKYRNDNSSLILMLPYATAEYLNNQKSFHKYYSDIEISDKSLKSYPKSAIRIRNNEMVERADLIICYIETQGGGAYQAMKYAAKIGKRIINLANL